MSVAGLQLAQYSLEREDFTISKYIRSMVVGKDKEKWILD